MLSDLDPTDGSILSLVSVSVHGLAAGATSVTINGQAASLDNTGLFVSPQIALQEGDNTLQLVAEDAAGNRTLATLRLTRDTIPPTLTITEPAEGAFVSGAELTVIGTTSDPHLENVRVQGQTATLAGDTFRRDQVALTPGANTILVEARDAAGNTTRAERHVILDSEPPVIRFLESNLEVQEGARFSRAVAITVDVQDATATTTEIQLDGAPYVSGALISSEGTHTLAATATDAAGSRSSRSLTFEIDLSAPIPMHERVVPTDWVDYNGHTNDSRYMQITSEAGDKFMRLIGVDEAYLQSGRSYYTVESHLNFIAQSHAGDALDVTVQLLSHDAKRLHIFTVVRKVDTGAPVATAEHMMLHVDADAGKASPASAEIQAKLADIAAHHDLLPKPQQVGRHIGQART